MLTESASAIYMAHTRKCHLKLETRPENILPGSHLWSDNMELLGQLFDCCLDMKIKTHWTWSRNLKARPIKELD